MRSLCLYLLALLALLLGTAAWGAPHYTNSLGMNLMPVPAGQFFMGSCKLPSHINAVCPSGERADPQAKSNEAEQHFVKISQPFYLGQTEVTVAQFRQFIDQNQRNDLLSADFLLYNQDPNAAVSFVSWQDAADFIHWLNAQEQCDCYFLPTEAQWEYAAKAAPFNQPIGSDTVNEYAYNRSNAQYQAMPVGQKRANALGIFDLLGNVDEWVRDWYQPRYPSADSTNPEGAPTGQSKVYRGGSIFDNPQELRASARFFASPQYKRNGLGFRIARKKSRR